MPLPYDVDSSLEGQADSSRLSIIIPAFNEEEGIVPTLESLKSHPRLASCEIIVVDDGSSDETVARAKSAGATVLRNRINRGYGASLKRGVRAATGPVVAWFDADGQHQADDLVAMLDFLCAEKLDAVVGERTKDSHFVPSRSLGKRVLRAFAEFTARREIKDVNCGLRVFNREVLLRYLHLLPEGFSASTTSTLLMFCRNYDVEFFPIKAVERQGGKSTVKQIRDGFYTLYTIQRLLFLFGAVRIFGWSSALLTLGGLAYGAIIAVTRGQGFPTLGALLTILGIQLFFTGVVCDQVAALRLEGLEAFSKVQFSAESSRDKATKSKNESERRNL